MTLHKSIEAARGALKEAHGDAEYRHALSIIDGETASNQGMKAKKARMYQKALSTLPTEPPTEEEIFNKLHPFILIDALEARQVIRALRDAGLLYVKEEE